MKSKILFLCGLMLGLIGCGENPLAPPGAVSFCTGDVSSVSGMSMSDSGFSASDGPEHHVYDSMLYVKKLEISETGQEWITVFEGYQEVNVKSWKYEQETIKIGDLANVKDGQYHAIRLTLAPKCRLIEISDFGPSPSYPEGIYDITIERPPSFYPGDPTGDVEYLFSSAYVSGEMTYNRRLVPFDIERNAETVIVFGFTVWASDPAISSSGEWEWYMWPADPAVTRYIY